MIAINFGLIWLTADFTSPNRISGLVRQYVVQNGSNCREYLSLGLARHTDFYIIRTTQGRTTPCFLKKSLNSFKKKTLLRIS